MSRASRHTLTPNTTISTGDTSEKAQENSAEKLAALSKQQVAMGIGASMVTLINVF